jgi:hypothetical protein
MKNSEPEIVRAWEELSFWRDFAVWWRAKYQDANEPRLLEALENAETRFRTATLEAQQECARNRK